MRLLLMAFLVSLVHVTPALAQLCLDPPGLSIVAFGESNTSPPISYANKIRSIRNCGIGGTAFFATPYGSVHSQLAEALLDPAFYTAIFSFGINDVGYCLLTPSLVPIDCTAEAIVDQAEIAWNEAVANGVTPYIATSHIRLEPPGAAAFTAEINAEITARFPPSQIIDFTTGLEDMCADPGCVHLNEEGQWLRVARTVEVLGLPDRDGDGVADEDDNCLDIPNGPFAGVCAQQPDGDADGYGAACDTDFNGNGMTDMADLGVMVAAVTEVSTEVRFDLNCNGAADAVDQGVVLMDFLQGGEPGPSGKLCAGAVPCQ